MNNLITTHNGLRYVEAGNPQGQVLLLLHGLFGALSNFNDTILHFQKDFRIAVPILPIYELPTKEIALEAYVDYVNRFVRMMEYDKVHVMGNSLGGHIALLYAFAFPEKIKTLTLTGSSGLFEHSLGATFPPRSNYDFVKEKTEATFYNPAMATKELVDEVYDIVNNRDKLLSVLATSKSAIRNNVEDRLPEIQAPTLLIWGKQDTITPPFVGEKFKEGIKNAELVFFDECGHAPMMEQPEHFNKTWEDFLRRHL